MSPLYYIQALRGQTVGYATFPGYRPQASAPGCWARRYGPLSYCAGDPSPHSRYPNRQNVHPQLPFRQPGTPSAYRSLAAILSEFYIQLVFV